MSQGHSDAVRRVDGVLDARQYTIPVEDVVNRVNGETPDFTKEMQKALLCGGKEEADKENQREIVNMPGYFADYDTFVSMFSKKSFWKTMQSFLMVVLS